MKDGSETEAFTFVVLHRAAPQGSKVMDKGRNGKPFMRESSQGVRPFRTALRRAAQGADGRPRRQFTGPVVVGIEFEFRQAKSNTDPYPTVVTIGDIDKLTRAVLDGLVEAKVIEDDSFVIDLERVTKRWGLEDRAIITVSPVSEYLTTVDSQGRTTHDFVGSASLDTFVAMEHDYEADRRARNPFE